MFCLPWAHWVRSACTEEGKEIRDPVCLFTERATRALRCPGLSDTLRIFKTKSQGREEGKVSCEVVANLLYLSSAWSSQRTCDLDLDLASVQREKRARRQEACDLSNPGEKLISGHGQHASRASADLMSQRY